MNWLSGKCNLDMKFVLGRCELLVRFRGGFVGSSGYFNTINFMR